MLYTFGGLRFNSIADGERVEIAGGVFVMVLEFQHAGVVTLGCNIHDDMLGYILIVDTGVFSKTNNVGRATLVTNYSGETDVHIWSPRLRDKGAALSQRVLVSDSEKKTAKFTLTKN